MGFNRLGIIYSFNSNICVSGSQLSSRAIRRVLLPFTLVTTPAHNVPGGGKNQKGLYLSFQSSPCY